MRSNRVRGIRIIISLLDMSYATSTLIFEYKLVNNPMLVPVPI